MKCVRTSYILPIMSDRDKKKKNIILKPVNEYSNVEIQKSSFNSNAFNANFNGVDINKYDLISTCTTTRMLVTIFEILIEGDNLVKRFKLQKLAIEFENLRMNENEELADFNGKLLKIANTSYSPSKRISDEELVRKFLRSLPNRFLIKIGAIEEYCDISTMTKKSSDYQTIKF